MTVEIPDYDDIRSMLVSLENGLNAALAFGSPTQLFTMNIESSFISCCDVPLPSEFQEGSNLRGLLELGISLNRNTPGIREVIYRLIDERTFGWVIMTETLSNRDISVLDNLLADEKTVVEHPSTMRTRVVLGMDLLGRVYCVTRQEDQEQIDLCDERAPFMSGNAPMALFLLNSAVAAWIRGGEHFVDALNELRIYTNDEMDLMALDATPAARLLKK